MKSRKFGLAHGYFLWVVIVASVTMLLLLTACGGGEDNSPESDSDRQREAQEQVRSQRPIPPVEYSQTYETIIKWMERWNTPGKVSYVYVMADNGQSLGYYVAQGRPVNICTFLTKPYTWDKRTNMSESHLVPAPALDGVYYGDSGCDSWYFFTADTDAFVELIGFKVFVADQLLSIVADPIEVISQ